VHCAYVGTQFLCELSKSVESQLYGAQEFTVRRPRRSDRSQVMLLVTSG
jgi:hypothetical protein